MRRALTAAALLTAALGCQQAPQPQAAQSAAPAKGTREWKIQSALAAAPASISSGAAIVEMGPNGLSPLRPGTNGWTCVADDTTEHHMGAICADSVWLGWFAAWMGHKNPVITRVATSYMLAGSNDASNTDPFATAPAAGQQWVVNGPHLMMLAPGAHPFAGLPTEPTGKSPYVMFPNTPYAHLMVPAAAPHATM